LGRAGYKDSRVREADHVFEAVTVHIGEKSRMGFDSPTLIVSEVGEYVGAVEQGLTGEPLPFWGRRYV
jgi:hypothetical protein